MFIVDAGFCAFVPEAAPWLPHEPFWESVAVQSRNATWAGSHLQRRSRAPAYLHFLPTGVPSAKDTVEFLPDRHLSADRSGLLIPKLYLPVVRWQNGRLFNLLRIFTDGRPWIANDWQLRATGSCAG